MSNRRRAVPTISAASADGAHASSESLRRSSGSTACTVDAGARRPRTCGARSRSCSTLPQLGVCRRGTTRTVGPGVDDDDPVDAVRLGHEGLHRLGVRHPVARPRRRPRPSPSPRPRARRRGARHRARRAAGRTSATVGKKRPGRGDVADLLEEHAQVAAGSVPSAANSARCAHERVGRRRVVDVRARSSAGRALLGEQGARRVAQQLLLRRSSVKSTSLRLSGARARAGR